MLMIRRYTPKMPGRAQQSAQEYIRNLTKLGKWIFLDAERCCLCP